MFCCKKKKSGYSPRNPTGSEDGNSGEKKTETGNGRLSLTISAPIVSGCDSAVQSDEEPTYENHIVIPKPQRKTKPNCVEAPGITEGPCENDTAVVAEETKESAVSTENIVLAELSELEAVEDKVNPEDLSKAITAVSQVLSQADGMSTETLVKAVSRLENVASRLESLANRQSGAKKSETIAPYVEAYTEILNGPFAKYLSLSNEIGDLVKTQSDLVKQAFQAQKDFLAVSSKSKQPGQDVLVKLLQPTSNKIQEIQDLREKNRGSKFFNHLSAISESIGCLGWVAVSPAPGPFVKEMLDSGTFYTNRVLKDYKDTDPRHVDWTKAWNQTVLGMQAYIKEHHTTGVTWNPQGGDASSAPAPPPAAGGAPPPPPPPGPPPPPPEIDSGVSSAGDADRGALFASINKGMDVTKESEATFDDFTTTSVSLKKVSDDMKTHKNPTLRQGPAPFKAAPSSAPKTAPKPSAKPIPVQTHPPLTELQNKKWIVQYHNGNNNIVVSDTELKQTVYVYKCTQSTVQIKGKVNSIILDSCKKTAIVFDDLVSSLEFVNCQSVKAQVNNKMPTVSIDKTDGCMIYLSKESLDTSIISAKSSEMNILVPGPDGEYKEFSLPEQFRSEWNGSKFVTMPTESV